MSLRSCVSLSIIEKNTKTAFKNVMDGEDQFTNHLQLLVLHLLATLMPSGRREYEAYKCTHTHFSKYAFPQTLSTTNTSS
jgi:hypothetical protein